jgi:polyphenol oxidase
MTSSLLYPNWPAPLTIKAVSSVRSGGVSLGNHASLNLGDHVGDDSAAVASNRQRLRAMAELPTEPVWLRQVHGNQVVLADSRAVSTAPPATADAVVSRTVGNVCAILTADCMPVLFCSTDGAAVAAAHAGWRGLAEGVLENTVRSLREMLAANVEILAWLGPAISAAHFEVGEDVFTAFTQRDAKAAQHFTRNTKGRWQANLYALARQRLLHVGVSNVTGGDYCTYADETLFFSHRRDVQHRGAAATGRMATLIWRQQ